jgi:bifunctional DNA-binding transcriptional regulator/antitoxin component of YhaV-PrlF toxin-antitoxin module
MATRVKDIKKGHTRISSKNQVTIPAAALAEAGLEKGDRLRAEVRGRGKVLLVREKDPVEVYAGILKGVYRGSLDRLRKEWR